MSYHKLPRLCHCPCNVEVSLDIPTHTCYINTTCTSFLQPSIHRNHFLKEVESGLLNISLKYLNLLHTILMLEFSIRISATKVNCELIERPTRFNPTITYLLIEQQWNTIQSNVWMINNHTISTFVLEMQIWFHMHTISRQWETCTFISI